MNKLPRNVKLDLDSGFIMTAVDDGFQWCRIISDSVFEYRSEVRGQEVVEIIDVDDIDHEEAVCGYYGSVEEVRKEYGKLLMLRCLFQCSERTIRLKPQSTIYGLGLFVKHGQGKAFNGVGVFNVLRVQGRKNRI